GRELDTAGGALEQGHAHLFFQLLDLHADGGQRDEVLLGGLAEAGVLGHRDEGRQQLEVDLLGHGRPDRGGRGGPALLLEGTGPSLRPAPSRRRWPQARAFSTAAWNSARSYSPR